MKKIIVVALLCICTASLAVASTNTKLVAKKKPSATQKAAANAAASPPVARTLEAIRIEGEIDVPQVLFITARDYRRFRDRTPAAYQTTSADIAKTIPHPNRVRMVAPVE
jgi:hypothetical protein